MPACLRPLLLCAWMASALAPAWASGPNRPGLTASALDSPASEWSRGIDLRELAQQGQPVPSPLDKLHSATGGWGAPLTVAACTVAVLANSAADGGATSCPGVPAPVDSRANVVPRDANPNRRP